MDKKPKRSRRKLWIAFGAIYLVIYIIGYLALQKFLCAPPADITTLCTKSLELWPVLLVAPIVVLMARFKAALRAALEYRAQRNKWSNWKPPR